MTLIESKHIDKGVGFKLEIYQDNDPSLNPRKDFDNLGTIYCEHRRYDLSDDNAKHPENFDADELIVLPIYMYEHSGITIKTTPFNCPWDSGQVGVIYVTKEKVMKEWGVSEINEELEFKIKQSLISEIKIYNQYLTGDMYGFIIKDINGEEIDSCWGFFGDDHEASGLIDHALSSLPQETQLKLF